MRIIKSFVPFRRFRDSRHRRPNRNIKYTGFPFYLFIQTDINIDICDAQLGWNVNTSSDRRAVVLVICNKLTMILRSMDIQSTLVISKSKGPYKPLRDIRTTTYQICSFEAKRF